MSLLVREYPDGDDKPSRLLKKVFHRMWKSLWINSASLWGKLKKCFHTREIFPFRQVVEKPAENRRKGCCLLLKILRKSMEKEDFSCPDREKGTTKSFPQRHRCDIFREKHSNHSQKSGGKPRNPLIIEGKTASSVKTHGR